LDRCPAHYHHTNNAIDVIQVFGENENDAYLELLGHMCWEQLIQQLIGALLFVRHRIAHQKVAPTAVSWAAKVNANASRRKQWQRTKPIEQFHSITDEKLNQLQPSIVQRSSSKPFPRTPSHAYRHQRKNGRRAAISSVFLRSKERGQMQINNTAAHQSQRSHEPKPITNTDHYQVVGSNPALERGRALPERHGSAGKDEHQTKGIDAHRTQDQVYHHQPLSPTTANNETCSG
jgi:hypothetical protein